MAPFFSVIVPVYNAEPYLRQCADSILAQTFPDLELLLVDDGSPDGSGAICDEYAAKDARVQAIHQPNAGPSPARRSGLAKAKGTYVCFVDSDDWVVPHWLETVKNCIDGFGQPDMVLFDVFRVGGGEPIPHLFIPEGYYDKARLEAEVYPYMLSDLRRIPDDPRQQDFGCRQLFPGYLCSKAFRRELVTAHFISDDRITVFEDMAMVYECAYFSRSICVSHEELYAYRYLPVSNLRHYRPDYLAQINAFFDYVTARLGCRGPQFAVQINAFCTQRIIACIIGELQEKGSVPAAARAFAAAARQTGLAGKLSFRGLTMRLRLFLLVVKLRLALCAVLMVKLRL